MSDIPEPKPSRPRNPMGGDAPVLVKVPTRVSVADMDIPFWSAVSLIFKLQLAWCVASAILVMSAIGVLFFAFIFMSVVAR